MLTVLSYILTIGKVFILREYLHWLNEENSQEEQKGWILLGILTGALLLNMYLKSRATLIVSRATTAMEASIYSILVKKLTNSLKGPQSKKFQNLDMGKISMVLTGDIRKISMAGRSYHNIFLLPVLLIVYLTMIIIELKWVGALCPLLIILSLLIQTKFNTKVFSMDRVRRKEADARNKIISEFISGAKYMKMNAWEPLTLDKTETQKKKEKGLLERMFL